MIPWRCCAHWMHGRFVALALMLAPPLLALTVLPLEGREVSVWASGSDSAFRSWTFGSRVHATNGGDASVLGIYARSDSTAASAVLATVALGTKGTLRSGPFLASDGGQRWKVAWDGTVTGWSRQIYLVMDSLAGVPPPPPPPPPIATLPRLLLVVPDGLTPLQGSLHAFYAIVRDSLGNVLPGVHATWSSSDTTIAFVDSSTQPVNVRAVGPGVATITAVVSGLQASSKVNVAAVSYGPPVRANFFGSIQTVYPGPHVYLIPDSAGHYIGHAFVTIVVP